MRPEIAQRIEAGCVVVTPNRRLAAWLTREHDAAQARAGRRVWPSADCLPLGAWLERTQAELTRGSGRALLMTPAQELALWEGIISESREARPLLHRSAAARGAREAWGILHAFRLELPRKRGALGEDAAAFARWSARYSAQTAARELLDAARLPDAVAGQAGNTAPRHLVFYAFDVLPPQIAALAEALTGAGWRVENLAPPQDRGAATQTAYPDAEAELRGVASQVRAILERTPAAEVGVIVPELAERRAQVLRILDDTLEPARVLAGSRERARPYNVSLGRALSEHPLAHAALLVLACARRELPLADAGMLVKSPFIAGAESEFAARALFDARLRSRGALNVPLAALVGEASSRPRGSAGTPLLGARLARWVEAAERARRLRQPPSAWSATFQGLLAGLGWPGERALDSEEFQTFDKWREIVAGLSALDLVSGPLGFEDALAALRRLAADTPFQPESEEAPVQVLGMLEATALDFDHLFVTGLTDDTLPASPRPNPFLPFGMQRRLAVPHASAEWETQFARRALAQWRAAAPRVSLSYPSQDGERALRGSPLLAGIPETPPPAAALLHREAVFAARAIETLADFAAPPLAPGVRIGGGASFFKNQADCPFRAFAVHRLGAEALESGHAGLDARERGTLAHEAAAALWREVKTYARLDAMSENEIARAAESAASSAVRRMRGERPDVMTEAFSRLERERVSRLLAALLRVEKLRAPFEVVACEERRPIALGGVEGSVRVDRIDRLADGSRVVLDYKTGRARSPARWLDERPDEPQLPLYVVTDAGEVSAAAFVALSARETGFSGIARVEGVLPEVPTVGQVAGGRYAAWSELTTAWRAALQKLAAEYLSGSAPVAPKDYPRTCEHCDIQTLCRVRELLDRGPVVEPPADAREDGEDGG